MNKVILIDDDYAKGWEVCFRAIFKKFYEDLIEFEALHEITNESIEKCYQDNPNALFIQDNQLGDGVHKGLHFVEKFAKTRRIILHTADKGDVGFKAGLFGALMHMRKDDPADVMSQKVFQEMILDFHKVVIREFKLAPELLWLVINEMNYKNENIR